MNGTLFDGAYRAVEQDKPDLLSEFVRDGFDPHGFYICPESAGYDRACNLLRVAVDFQAREAFVRLLELGVSPNIIAKPPNELGIGMEPIAHYILGKHTELAGFRANLVASLLDYGADVNLLDGDGRTPLIAAAMAGPDLWDKEYRQVHFRALDHLLAQSPLLNVADRLGYTALHLAARNGHTSVVAELLAAGADANPGPDYSGSTPIDYAIRHSLLFPAQHDVLLAPARSGLEMLTNLLYFGADPSPLHYAKLTLQVTPIGVGLVPLDMASTVSGNLESRRIGEPSFNLLDVPGMLDFLRRWP